MEAASDWAWEMGLVFQMTDDVLDLVATPEYLGKPAGSDIGEGTFTLPVLYALEDSDGNVQELLAGGHPYPQETVDRVIEVVRSGGHVDRVIAAAVDRLSASEKAVDRLPDSQITGVLRDLGRYLLERVEAARAS